MDSLSNYENMAQNLNQEAQASKMLAFNKHEAAKQEKNSLVEGLRAFDHPRCPGIGAVRSEESVRQD